MQILRNKRYGLQDIYALPDGRRDELLDGQLCMMASPITTRQRILNFVSIEIYLYLRNNKGECEVYPAPFAAFPDADAEKYLNDARFPDCSCEISYPGGEEIPPGFSRQGKTPVHFAAQAFFLPVSAQFLCRPLMSGRMPAHERNYPPGWMPARG